MFETGFCTSNFFITPTDPSPRQKAGCQSYGSETHDQSIHFTFHIPCNLSLIASLKDVLKDHIANDMRSVLG